MRLVQLIEFHLCIRFLALLCGITGHLAFIDENIARETVQWQVAETGCYAYFDGTLPSANDETNRTKRHAAILQNNCSDHTTGVSAAAFGLYAKVAQYFNAQIL